MAAVAFAALALRIALLLGATPVGAMRQEILYLRNDHFKPLVRLVLLFLGLEATQLALPLLVDLEVARAVHLAWGDVLIDLAQAVLLVVIAAGALRAFSPYSRRSLAELEVLARRSIEAVSRRVGTRREAQPPSARPRRGS